MCITRVAPRSSERDAASALTALVGSPSLMSKSSAGKEDMMDIDEEVVDADTKNNELINLPQRFTKSGRKKAVPFPVKLMKVLSDNRFRDIICWTPSGKSFTILQPKAFASEILPEHFKQAKYSSFTRKLHRWGFNRHFRGAEAGSFYHDEFQRGRLDLAENMSCYTGPSTPKSPTSKKVIKNLPHHNTHRLNPLLAVPGSNSSAAAASSAIKKTNNSGFLFGRTTATAYNATMSSSPAVTFSASPSYRQQLLPSLSLNFAPHQRRAPLQLQLPPSPAASLLATTTTPLSTSSTTTASNNKMIAHLRTQQVSSKHHQPKTTNQQNYHHLPQQQRPQVDHVVEKLMELEVSRRLQERVQLAALSQQVARNHNIPRVTTPAAPVVGGGGSTMYNVSPPVVYNNRNIVHPGTLFRQAQLAAARQQQQHPSKPQTKSDLLLPPTLRNVNEGRTGLGALPRTNIQSAKMA